MKISYHDLDLKFTMDYLSFYPIHIVCERFLRSIPSHSHSDNGYEIHYIPEGRGKVKIDQVVYQVVPNTLYITGPHIEHEQIPDKEDPMIEYCIYLKLEKRKQDGKKERQASYLKLFEDTRIWFGQDNQNIHALMQQLFSELEKKHTAYKKQAETLLSQLIVSLIRNYENTQEIQNQTKPVDLSYSKYFIIEEYFLYEYKDLSLETLSSRLGLSSRQTQRLLNEHYGKNFQQKRTEARMSAASILLMDPKKSITEIALNLGYSSVEHFSAAFTRYYHISARQYRKNNSDAGNSDGGAV